jgi:glutamate-ammonia-ligase adenylyltransferase
LVGAEFIVSIRKLIYRDQDWESLARDILSMRQRMELEVGRENAAYYNIKQGAGGMVDIEFLVQYLQLIHGREHCWVRVPGTYNALRALHKRKLIPEETYQVLRQAYLFMRRLESRMRIISNQAASDLKRDPEKLYQLARRMGYQDGEVPAGRKLLSDYESSSNHVRSIFNNMIQ